MAEKRIPLGPTLELTENELTAAAEITSLDIKAVNSAWVTAAPKWAINLLLAERVG